MKAAKSKKWLGVGLGFLMATSASSAFAIAMETESNDTFATANIGVGGANLSGSIGDNSGVSNDVDIWKYSLDAGEVFSASIFYDGLYNANDVAPAMVLYMESGGSYYAVAGADPSSFATSFSFMAWTASDYFLTITADFNQGIDAFGNFSTDSQFQTTQSITGTAFDSFAGGSFTSFNYNVDVPEPSTVLLLGLAGLGLAAKRRTGKA